MLKKILNLTGAQQLSKKEQSSILGGGGGSCGPNSDQCNLNGCPSNEVCTEFRYGTLSNWYSCWECIDPGNPT